jgi:hypothetical protein
VTAKIDRKLNVVIPIEQEDGQTLHVHVTPVDSKVFTNYVLILGKAFSALYGEGYGVLSGPRIAGELLKEIAKNNNRWEDSPTGAAGVKHLVAEIRRNVNVLAPTDKGWEMLTLDDAVAKKLLDATDESEVENAACFFTLAWHMHSKKEREATIRNASVLWGAQATSSACTEYLRSLKTSTVDGNIGKSQA